MVSPVTNCSPIRRMAMSTPLRIIGSPLLPMMRLRDDVRPASLWVDTSLPVSSRPQVAALTNSDGLLPRCGCQLPVLILSRIRASRVRFVRNAQQRFGQAHQRHAFLGRQGEFLQQALNDAGTAAGALLVAQFSAIEAASLLVASAIGAGRRACSISIGTHFRLRAAVGGGDRGAQYRLRQDAFGEFEEALVGVIQRRIDGVVGILGQTAQLGQGCTTLEFSR